MNWENQPTHDGYRPYGPTDATQPVPAMTGPAGRPAKHRRKTLRWAAGIAAAVVLAGGGAIAGLDLSSSGSPSSGQAALLSAALGGASSPTPGASAPSGAGSGTAAGARARRVARILRHLRGVHGEFTVRVKGGGFREIAFERGVITAVSGKDVTVRAADGTTWAWTLVSDTVVRKNGARSSASGLATGDPVFVGGPEQATVRDARLIIVPKKGAAGQSGAQQGGAPDPSSS